MIRIYIPYKNIKNCIYREQAISLVYDFYNSVKDFEVKILSSAPFSRAAARNAVFENELNNVQAVFFADADIIVSENQVREAIKKSIELDQMVLAYKNLCKMNVNETSEYAKTKKLNRSRVVVRSQCSGAFAITTNLLKEVGGWDERFTSWGCEDRVFYYMSAFLRGLTYCTRLEGFAFHFFHPKSNKANKRILTLNDLHREYLDAFGISVDTLKSFKKPNPQKIFQLKKEAKNEAKKTIVPFEKQNIEVFRKKEKEVLAIKNTNLYKTLLISNDYELIGAVI